MPKPSKRWAPANATVFIDNAANGRMSFDVAKFTRYRAELLAGESVNLGTLRSYELVAGFVLNRDAAGRLNGLSLRHGVLDRLSVSETWRA